MEVRPPATFAASTSSIVATAIHSGHDLRPAIADRMMLDDATRTREEDPHTDVLIPRGSGSVIVQRSRFEMDLNRPREKAVYRTPDDSWGLVIWDGPLCESEVETSLEQYDAFYRRLGSALDEVAERGPLVVLDLHSYNHRRGGPAAAPADPAENPELNVGTGSLDRDTWGERVDEFIEVLRAQTAGGHPLDVRENVRFQGGNVSRWVNDRYEGCGFAIALEFKKVFMDEWSGEVDHHHLGELATALERAAPALSREAMSG